MSSKYSYIKRVAFIYLSLASSGLKRRVLEEKFMLRPKLGFGYLRAALKEINIESKVYDQVLMDFNAEELTDLLKKDNIDLIGFYAVYKNINEVTNFIKVVKSITGIPVIAGGPGCNHYNELIAAGCEILCLGEGDKSIIDIVDYYEGKKQLSDIKGISYRDASTGKISVTSERDLIGDLDSLPFPLRDKEMIRKYCDYFAYPLKKPYISIMASRGCPYHCAFCTSFSFWKEKYRCRSAENVVEEIKQAISELHIKSIYFIDDIFALDFNWLTKFCSLLKEEELNLNWMCNLHPLTFRKTREKAFLMMKEAGCNIVSFGAQSSDPDILKRINRDASEIAELEKAIYLAKSAGITTAVTYIFGLPGETLGTLKKNLEFCLVAKPHIVDFHALEIIPFSELSNNCEEEASGLDNNKLDQLSVKYMLSYYLRPGVTFQLLGDILNKNPARIFTFAKLFYEILDDKIFYNSTKT